MTLWWGLTAASLRLTCGQMLRFVGPRCKARAVAQSGTESEERVADKHAVILGHARVAPGQDPAEQIERLRAARCTAISVEQHSFRVRDPRPDLDDALDRCDPGDVFVVVALDRLARTARELHAVLERLAGRGAGFRSLSDEVGFEPEGGEDALAWLRAIEGWEAALARERTAPALEAARRAPRRAGVGRKRALSPEQIQGAWRRIEDGELLEDVAEDLGVSRSTLRSNLSEAGLTVRPKGRPRVPEQTIQLAREIVVEDGLRLVDAAKLLGVSQSTLSKYLALSDVTISHRRGTRYLSAEDAFERARLKVERAKERAKV